MLPTIHPFYSRTEPRGLVIVLKAVQGHRRSADRSRDNDARPGTGSDKNTTRTREEWLLRPQCLRAVLQVTNDPNHLDVRAPPKVRCKPQTLLAGHRCARWFNFILLDSVTVCAEFQPNPAKATVGSGWSRHSSGDDN